MIKRWLPLIVIVLLALLLAPLCRNLVQEMVVIPFLYIFWIGQFFYYAIPEILMWASCLTFLFLIMATSLLEKPRPGQRSRPPQSEEDGRVESWLALLRQAQKDDYFKWRLSQRLQRLALNKLAHYHDQPLNQLRQQLRNGQIAAMPPEIRAYFQSSFQSLGYISAPRRFFFQKRSPSPLDLDPAHVIAYLEDIDRS